MVGYHDASCVSFDGRRFGRGSYCLAFVMVVCVVRKDDTEMIDGRFKCLYMAGAKTLAPKDSNIFDLPALVLSTSRKIRTNNQLRLHM